MMSYGTPLFWLLEVEAYNYDIGVLKDADITGKVLIVSSQLWSILREDKVNSMLIGPGYFRGVAESGNKRVDIQHHLFGLMFDPTILRYDEPVPLVDIIKPEVIDPMASRRQEEIVTLISNLIVEKGNVLAVDPVASVRLQGSVPQVAHYTEIMKRINVSHVSGVQRARFILGGTNRPLYGPMLEYYQKRRYANPERSKVMCLPFNRFADMSDIEVMSDWMIVEKAGMGGTGADAIRSEYNQVYSHIEKNPDAYMYSL